MMPVIRKVRISRMQRPDTPDCRLMVGLVGWSESSSGADIPCLPLSLHVYVSSRPGGQHLQRHCYFHIGHGYGVCGEI